MACRWCGYHDNFGHAAECDMLKGSQLALPKAEYQPLYYYCMSPSLDRACKSTCGPLPYACPSLGWHYRTMRI
jgi:hypothetical protein